MQARHEIELRNVAEAGRYRSDAPIAQAALHLCGFREGLALQFLLDSSVDCAMGVEQHIQMYVGLRQDPECR